MEAEEERECITLIYPRDVDTGPRNTSNPKKIRVTYHEHTKDNKLVWKLNDNKMKR